MADKDYKAFIVEGEDREPQVIDNISKVFFKHGNFKISCLLGNAEVISYEQYLDEASPYNIFMCEQALAGNNKVFIISAFPEFLVDYFGMKLWKTCVKHTKNQWNICNCK